MLEARNLRKAYGKLQAVDDVSLFAAKGEVIGLLGPNGAGKTTTIAMLAGLLAPDSGQVLIDGQPIHGDTNPVKRRLGLVTQDLALFDELSAAANLNLFGALYGLSGSTLNTERQRVLELTGLAPRANDKTAAFSGGMKRRLNLAAALMHNPQVILLDEPTVGVDPQSRNAIFDNLEALKASGKTLLYTTHYMEEAARLCDRIAIIDHGKIIASGTLPALLRRAPVTNIVHIHLQSELTEKLPQLDGILQVTQSNSHLTIGVQSLEILPPLLTWLQSNAPKIEHLETERPNLESVFLHLTGRTLRD